MRLKIALRDGNIGVCGSEAVIAAAAEIASAAATEIATVTVIAAAETAAADPEIATVTEAAGAATGGSLATPSNAIRENTSAGNPLAKRWRKAALSGKLPAVCIAVCAIP